MTREEELLLEQVTSAHRERGLDGAVRFHPSWYDLDEPARAAAFEATVELRKLEAAMDPEGMSSTVRALLARVEGR
jgi:hypothetical protein